MAESRKNGGESNGALSVYPDAVSDTHESSPGDEGNPGANADGVLKKGDALGRYLVLDQLGAGAMGVVYAAYDPELDRKIAIKILRPHEGKGDRTRRQERLVREAKAMAKLSHPNVGAIYDVGVHGDQVFLAMEFLSGGTLSEWMKAKKRPWREIVKMFIEVGKGLAGAHAEGLIHRDFKPDNVLLDKNGAPKVVDFGLVRLTSAALDRSTTGSMDAATLAEDTYEDAAAGLPVARTALAALTRTGALTGTPAYMASEQFLGKAIDARTDQFAFCVALYEALYGERPFAGDTVIAIADSVTSETVKAAPKHTDIPNWVRRCLLRGLRSNPRDRFDSIDHVVAALRSDPALVRRKRLLIAGVVAACASVIVGAQQFIHRRRAAVEAQVAEHVNTARSAQTEAADLASQESAARQLAMSAYQSGSLEHGDESWAKALRIREKEDAKLRKALQSLEAAFALDPRNDIRAALADLLVKLADKADEQGDATQRDAVLAKLASYDVDRTRAQAFNSPAYLTLETTPGDAKVAVERYEADPRGRYVAKSLTDLDIRSGTRIRLAAGSYRITASAPGHATVYFPIVIHRATSSAIQLRLLAAPEVPDGFQYIPRGRFLFGDRDEALRRSFLNAAPLHEAETPAFFIARRETTYAEWIAFIEDLPSAHRSAHLPRASAELQAGLSLRASGDKWELTFQPAKRRYVGRWNVPVHYLQREHRADQDWRQFPVAGISASDIAAYLQWLRAKRGLSGARLCSEKEWERAARGADDRVFPHGASLAPDDANFDETYGRTPFGFGPDAVGSHPASRSPFGIDDLAGNVMEVTRSVFAAGGEEYVLRGGSYYYNAASQRSTNREPVDANARTANIGLRVCLDAPN